MKKGDEVQFINNQNEVDSDICEVIESIDKFCRIKRPNGQIIRIFNDRLRPVTKKEEENSMTNEDYNPWDNLPTKGEVWIKSNRFNETTICETIAIIDPENNIYKSINTYSGKAQKVMTYPMKNYDALIKRMIRKGYIRKKVAFDTNI